MDADSSGKIQCSLRCRNCPIRKYNARPRSLTQLVLRYNFLIQPGQDYMQRRDTWNRQERDDERNRKITTTVAEMRSVQIHAALWWTSHGRNKEQTRRNFAQHSIQSSFSQGFGNEGRFGIFPYITPPLI